MSERVQMTMRTLIVIAMVASCGPRPEPVVVPMLPGDGDSHVAKPAPVPAPATTDAWTGRNDLIPPPVANSPASIELPKIEEFKLANGLAVYAVKSSRLPVVSFQLAVRAGRMQEPRARLGVSELTADMLVKGTKQRDAAALAKAIDFVGGTIAADSTFEATMVSCSVLVRNASTCLELLPEMVTQPSFPDAELARLRDMLIGTVRRRFDDPAALASSHAQNLLWGNTHVRGWINSEQSIAALRRDDLVTWHRTWFVPGNAMLVVTGDIDLKKLKGDLERAFGGWRKGPVPPTPTYSEQGLSGSRIRLVDKPGLTQTQIRIAQYGIKHQDPRFFETLVWNFVLGGGGGASRLARSLRGDGKVFGVTSSFDRNLDRGSFVAGATARNSDAIATTKVMLAEIAKLAKEGPTREEVAGAIISITGGYGLRFQAASDFGAALMGAELHGFGQEYLMNFPLAVGAVSVEDARRAAAEILDPKAYVVVLVGDAKDLEPQLKAAGWIFEKVAFSDPITAPSAQPEQPVDAKAVAEAHKLIDEAIAAKGGKAKLAGIKSLKLVAAGTTTIQGQGVPVEVGRTLVEPDKMRIDFTIKPPGAPHDILVTIGMTGNTGWQRAPEPSTGEIKIVELAGAGLATAAFEHWREPELILLKAADAAAKLTVAPDETIDGKPHGVIRLRTPFGEVDVTLYIDRKTKLVSRMSYSEGGAAETDEFADYRDAGGLKIAYKRTSTGGGRSTTLEVKSFELDPKVDAAAFTKPAK